MRLFQKPLLFSSTFAVVGILVSAFLFFKTTELAKHREQIFVQQATLKNQLSSLDQLQKTIDAKKEEVEHIETMLPSTLDEFVIFTNALSSLATASGQLLKLGIQEPKIDKKDNFSYHTETINLNLEGTYSRLLLFLERLYAMPFYITFDKIAIKKATQNSTVQTSLQLTLFMK